MTRPVATTMMNKEATAWLQRQSPSPDAALRLFCFPYAGGAANIYRSWSRKLQPSVEVCPVQPPGRGSRLQEPPFTKVSDLVEAAATALRPYFDKPFALFGHSMGAIIAFELARYLRREQGPTPARLFISGRPAPQLNKSERPIYNLPQSELKEELRRLNGTPPEVLEHPELMELMLPLLRADFSVCDTYVYTDEPPLDCGIVAFGGLRDRGVPREKLEAWREQTDGPFAIRMFPGDHFFIHADETLLLRSLARDLQELIDA
jgi:medium-chain acyl-[acyl-carrier-protein] hydrolase